ncbi:hypothetical protein T5B8_19308 [Salinisphaera sp. T5B8]|uniref:hypothetical protein n=1 Tax=Salinisphaera sp. T5B8 TaxID=1304154 RepID=UPI0033411253
MTTAAPQSLRDFNDLLEQANLPRLTTQQFEQLRATNPRKHLISAITTMQADSNARIYIERSIQEVGAEPVPAAPQAAARAPQPQRAPAPQQPAQSGAPDFGPPSAPPQGQPAPAAQNDNAPSDFEYTMHVYGGKAALCFEPTTTRGEDFTVALDSATASAPRQYDWKNKLRLQLTRDELPVVAGVLLGLIQRCEYKNHGPNNDKGFSIEDQGNKLFVRTWAKDHPARAVPMTPEDAYRVATLFLRQLGLNAPWMSASDIIQTIRMVVARRVASGANNG